MAQHIPVEGIDNEQVRKTVQNIRKYRYFSTSMKFEELPLDFAKNDKDRAYVTHRSVPESLVFGGKASYEVHTKPDGMGGRIATEIYLVA